ncbi:ABC transporter permease [Spirosoma sordidisoli]|uniref:ABC transporter permease n=1 Tax=Spirosoma sordidisoli TaxID=2502893 RepID=A0A4Q2UHM0_9BACT|nr:ABC transporter permease [Spirosoma sordidisoli]RYC68903.1 ABC transporter permease [Spirosoma sordidisoli]
MLRNYIRIAIRNLWTHRTFTLINVAGLATGIATSLLILEYVSFERSYDLFHQDVADIYRIRYNQLNGEGELAAKATTVASVGPGLQQAFPEVASMVRFHRSRAQLSYETPQLVRRFREDNVLAADPSFLTFFSFPLLKGNAATALRNPTSIVITQTLARKYFGNEEPVGKTLKMTGGYGDWAGGSYRDVSYYTVTGVLADSPANSHLSINALVSFTLFSRGEAELSNWGDSFYTYVRLRPGASAGGLDAKLPDYIRQTQGEASKDELQLQPLSRIHLDPPLLGEPGTNGSRLMVGVLLVVALFTSLIAWINYVNLATARATERAKEVGVRKVTGASGADLLRQFLLEALLLNTISMALAAGLVSLVQPTFNELVGQPLSLRMLTDQVWLLVCASFFAGGVLLSSLYPIFVNITVQPAAVLRGQWGAPARGLSLRKGLVVFQFVLSMLLIAGALGMYHQLTFMQRYDVGIRLDQRLVINGPATTDSTYQTKLNEIRARLLNTPGVQQVTASNLIPGKPITGLSRAGLVRRLNQREEESAGRYYFSAVDYSFPQTFGARLAAGRWFSPAFGADAAGGQSVVINETAARMLGYARPAQAIGQRINYRMQQTPTIVGVLRDYHQLSLRKALDPIIFELGDAPDGYLTVSLRPDQLPQTMVTIQQIWQKTFPDSPFSSFFLDEFFNRQYQLDWTFAYLAGLFAGLAIVVASLGLFGLAYQTTLQRNKEIGVRKVLGASVASIVALLSKDFLKLVVIAIVIASPLAWYALHRWLQNFAYKIDIEWWVFALAGLLAVGIALLTVSFQSVKAALMNPVRSLRSE